MKPARSLPDGDEAHLVMHRMLTELGQPLIVPDHPLDEGDEEPGEKDDDEEIERRHPLPINARKDERQNQEEVEESKQPTKERSEIRVGAEEQLIHENSKVSVLSRFALTDSRAEAIRKD